MKGRTYRGQVYIPIGKRTRERRDGTMAELIVWQSGCAECGAPFEFTTPAKSSKFEPNRRCQKHKRPGQKVREREA